MDNEELYDEIDTTESITQRYLGLSSRRFLFLFSIVVVLGIYLGILLYGTSSLEVLFGLQEYGNYLENEIVRLKLENADLQREYFELKEISAQ
ncbi:hypothetical protein GJV85_12465 [Sulfurimonas aquatica]|uniref:Septum formation initiator n=1 Tax=Sulfurimonas aquatica TaxID=2672570 RepID=A0A975B271_9BACT|nr:hypothetical protein [Sulfurimonas aquatica]QSZ42887.1 hypothetical protein GJV85_12465 [Sulfurimonas aquatica]